jgi:hypothetical protein
MIQQLYEHDVLMRLVADVLADKFQFAEVKISQNLFKQVIYVNGNDINFEVNIKITDGVVDDV